MTKRIWVHALYRKFTRALKSESKAKAISDMTAYLQQDRCLKKVVGDTPDQAEAEQHGRLAKVKKNERTGKKEVTGQKKELQASELQALLRLYTMKSE